MAKIIYTRTDEAPLLATYSLKPVIEAFASTAGVKVETRDISLASRILAAFDDLLPEDQRVPDTLAELGAMTKQPDANIIKLPNISASVPQLKAAVAELQADGYALPDFPDEPATDAEKDARARYDSVKGSAVNPVLREGNSDRRAPQAVKNFARKHPHHMGAWSKDSKTNVATMSDNDFRHNEKSVVIDGDDTLQIRLTATDGTVTVLKEALPVLDKEIVDATVLSAAALDEFLKAQVAKAKEQGVLFSAHLKATMMKVSDPIIFGHVVRSFFAEVFDTYGDILLAHGLNGENGLAAIYSGLDEFADEIGADKVAEIRAAFDKGFAEGPAIAMVNSAKGVTNLHVPSDVIVDASMPAMIRTSGHMWNKDNEEQDTLAVLPDSSYAGVYQVVIDDCRKNGAFDPTTMGTVPNVGLMAQKAEEYGSHDKTFKIPAAGTVDVVNTAGEVLLSHEVAEGDIWRACQAKDIPVRDWVKLAVNRARATGWPAVFWLDPERAHDNNIRAKVEECLTEHDTDGLDIRILSPEEACQLSVDRIRAGENTISVTGNVLRDYLTDLFPIMELGTSAKMLSIVPLIAGGGLFETGAGGSAPKHVQQLIEEDYLRWDSLGEFLALAESLRKLAETDNNPRTPILADALDKATEKVLNEDKSPARVIGEIDNRGSHYYLATYWARNLAEQTDDPELAEIFAPVATALEDGFEAIKVEMRGGQGSPVDLGGYYLPDDEKTTAVMRPSKTFNGIIDGLADAHR
jgi:isocitrate dehydrogenase